jgi:hypothetical protein
MRRASFIFAAALSLFAPLDADAVCPGRCPIPGGGSVGTDCFVEFDGIVPNTPAARPTYLRCSDGDPACDVDATVDGVCTTMISVCFNNFDSRFPGCLPRRAFTFDLRGAVRQRPGFEEELFAILQAATDVIPTDRARCSVPQPWRVELKTKKGVLIETTETLRTKSYGEVVFHPSRIDSDRVKVVCVPAAG